MNRYVILSLVVGLLSSLLVYACKSPKIALADFESPDYVNRIDPYPQPQGDPEKGYNYLIYGDYVGNGFPWEFMKKMARAEDTVLRRTGDNANTTYFFNVFTNQAGMKVVSGNCFSCHAGELNKKVVLGLGNTTYDFTQNTSFQISALNFLVKNKYGKDSPEWKSYEEQAKWLTSIAPAIVMKNLGTNPAFRLEEAAIKYRNPVDLTYQDSANFELPDLAIGTDVPPLWNVKKKHALYYNGMGRGNFSKLVMQACLLGIHDSTQARGIQREFKHVIAWLQQLEAPQYPKNIDQGIAKRGETIFSDNCSKCHGNYGLKETYPNKLVPISEVKTDSLYARYAMQSPVNSWYNSGWFHLSPPFAESKPSFAYIAPPLDGVWATAPYLHNGSVPTLEDLLDSSRRPRFWQRSMESDDYNYEKLGWNYEKKRSKSSKKTFDTTVPGFSNVGHYYGDKLNPEERKALIEYLKTL